MGLSLSKSLRIFTRLKNLVAISFIFLHLSTTTELGELFKLPALVHHYFEHEEEHDSASIFHFLAEHYAELHAAQNLQHDDHHKHLPFKSNDHSYLVSTVSIVPSIYSPAKSLGFFIKKSISTAKEICRYSYFPSDIWQPPRA